MENGDWNVVSLTIDRTLYFDKDNPGRYGDYDLKVLEEKDEEFGKVILVKWETSKIETSVLRKQHLLQTMFVEPKTSETAQQSSSSLPARGLTELTTDETVLPLSVIQTSSIIDLDDDKNCGISFENIMRLSSDHFIQDELEDDDDEAVLKWIEPVNVVIDKNEEKKLSYYERSMLNYQRLIWDKLENVTTRLSSVDQGLSYLYGRQSMPTIIKLLNDMYLIDVRRLDTRILSSFESENMRLFFRFVAFYMENDYSYRWNSIKEWLSLSLRPSSIEYNLLGFGKLDKMNKQKKMKIITSPTKFTTNIQYCNRSSHVTFDNSLNDNDKNIIIVFEATTSKIYFVSNILDNLANRNDKYSKSMKKLIYKLCQLERQIYYLSFYYSIGLNQFFGGLILYELYRSPSIDTDELLNKIMSSEVICRYVPLLFRLFKMQQLILTY
ncbi:unnamed protein product [Didymodactylos carnosus]|uniref:Uncharacterized protein n=1 Tax=Didymodactylos carnosus TaxID=1234261 RepID=A0A815GNP9_9BILA|nr:unnamed protein product [Didymodactylos carnosus]CAF1393583.1 unnamed protein product [Didymodactylos carnosus]CAF4201060.1 unnamed protein product [Didymodactylos carnosus]CAF4202449.1 unnamed protein product [Didymodactylos carnosus]